MVLAKVTVYDTGQGFTTTYSHRVHTDRSGTPCPILCYLTKGHENKRKVFQLINDTKGFLISSTGKEGRIRLKNNHITMWGEPWMLEELEASNPAIVRVKAIAQEVYSWKSGRECHFPPMAEMIVPEIESLEDIPQDLHNPGMKGGFKLQGTGKGEKNGGIFISKMWKLSMPHITEWKASDKLIISADSPLILNGGKVYVEEKGKVFIIEKRLESNNFLCTAPEEATIVIENKHTARKVKLDGQFRCGLIHEEKEE